jgi:hypothetical protein
MSGEDVTGAPCAALASLLCKQTGHGARVAMASLWCRHVFLLWNG